MRETGASGLSRLPFVPLVPFVPAKPARDLLRENNFVVATLPNVDEVVDVKEMLAESADIALTE